MKQKVTTKDYDMLRLYNYGTNDEQAGLRPFGSPSYMIL